MKRGDAEVMLRDMNGRPVKAVLQGTLFIPCYSHDIFFTLWKNLNQMFHNVLVYPNFQPTYSVGLHEVDAIYSACHLKKDIMQLLNTKDCPYLTFNFLHAFCHIFFISPVPNPPYNKNASCHSKHNNYQISQKINDIINPSCG